MLKKGITGKDLNKQGTKAGEKAIPECVGFAAAVGVCGVAVISALAVSIFTGKSDLSVEWGVLVAVLGTVLLGFADDMLDLPWRYKLIFPILMALPVVSVYGGPTTVNVIWPFSNWAG